MSTEDEITLAAAGYLRGDLPDLRPDTHEALEAALAEAIGDPDVAQAARRVREVTGADPGLGARLRSFERGLRTGDLTRGAVTRGFTLPPGKAGLIPITVWTCPQPPPGHYQRVQRVAQLTTAGKRAVR